jgi:hypothetical protein
VVGFGGVGEGRREGRTTTGVTRRKHGLIYGDSACVPIGVCVQCIPMLSGGVEGALEQILSAHVAGLHLAGLSRGRS